MSLAASQRKNGHMQVFRVIMEDKQNLDRLTGAT